MHWNPHFDGATSGSPIKPMLQDCHGGPGIICRLAGTRAAALRAMLLDARELVWQAGPIVKRPRLCHGTDGNGFVFLKLHAAAGEAKWFAMHASKQSDALAAQHGCRVPSLGSGDLGLAIFLQACHQGRAGVDNARCLVRRRARDAQKHSLPGTFRRQLHLNSSAPFFIERRKVAVASSAMASGSGVASSAPFEFV